MIGWLCCKSGPVASKRPKLLVEYGHTDMTDPSLKSQHITGICRPAPEETH